MFKGAFRVTRLINHMKIINKLMVMYVIGGLIPILLVSFYLLDNARNMLIDRAIEEATNSATRVEVRLEDIFAATKAISDGLSIDAHLERITKTRYKNDFQSSIDLNKYGRIDAFLKQYTEVDSVRFYVLNETLADNDQIIYAKEIQRESNWYKKAVSDEFDAQYMYKYDELSSAYYLSLVRAVKGVNEEIVGILVINIDNRYLGKIIRTETYEMVLALDHQVVLATDQYLEGKYLSNIPYMDKINQDGMSDLTYNGVDYKVLKSTLPSWQTTSDFVLYTYLPVEALVEIAEASESTSGKIILVSLIVSLLVIYLLSKAFSDRINLFRQDMHRVATGDFGVMSRVDGKDEVGQLSDDLNIMAMSIQQLIHEVYEVRLQKEQLSNKQREAEFKMLASQINPHFLYNALETIRMEAHMNGQKPIAEVVKKLGKIMRRNLSISNEEVPLSAEIELIRNYLEIQQFRFRDKVSFDFEVLCDIEAYKVLPLLLQPIVENAFVHGLEQKAGKGHITIRFEDEHQFLKVTIEDDGVGIEDKKLNYLNRLLYDDVQSIDGSIGMANVNQRIKIYYGERYGLILESQEAVGTSVVLMLPPKRGDRNA